MKKKKYFDNYLKSTGISPYPLLTNINIGYSYLKDNFVFFKTFFLFWVQMMDHKLDQVEPHSKEYTELIGKRFVTFPELKLIYDDKLPEGAYSRSRAYEFFYLDDSTEVKIFKSAFDDNRTIEEIYIITLLKWMKHEKSPLYQDFTKLAVPNQISFENLKRHLYILAGTGLGKSILLKCLLYQIQSKTHKSRNSSVLLIDPHGDLAREVLLFCMNKGIGLDRIVYLDTDIRSTAKSILGKDILTTDYYFSINPFKSTNLSEKDIPSHTEYLAEALFSIVDSNETFQMEAIIESCVESLTRMPKSSISDLKVFMDDSKNEELVKFGSTIPNPERAEFLANKFRNDGRLSNTKSSISMRLQKVLGNRIFQRSFGRETTVDIEGAMNSGKIVIVNMNKGAMGKSASIAAGKLIMSLITSYAFKRVHLPKNLRKDTFLIVDEFQNLISPSIEDILAETRKYALYGIFANQQMGQNMSPQIKRVVAGNTAIKFMADNEPESIEWMSKQMKHLSPSAIDNLPPYSFYVNDRFNKKAGSYVTRIPDFLVDMNSKYYLKQEDRIKLFKHLVNKSGIYKPVSEIKMTQTKQSNFFTHKFEE